MKIAFISDLHANLPAFLAVLEAIDKLDCMKILCGGDIVGYGPHPRECLEIVRKRKIACVRGNHDDMMGNHERDGKLRPEVRESILWTREKLAADDIQWLMGLPRALRFGTFELVHASNVIFPRWHYVIDRRSVAANFIFQPSHLAFNGHSHVPVLAAHKPGERARLVELHDLQLPDGYRLMVNVGSVGQPRDRNPMAAFVIYETRERRVSVHRVEYDISATQRDMARAGLPQSFALRLSEGR